MLVNHHPAGYCQPLSRSLSPCLGRKEGLKDPVLDFFGNTSSCIADPYLNAVVFRSARSNGNCPFSLASTLGEITYSVSAVDDDIQKGLADFPGKTRDQW